VAIENLRFNGLLHSQDYHDHLIGVVVDEAHCIVQWGGDFRPAYSKLDKLRSFVPDHMPIYATSAIMTPAVLAEVRRALHIDPDHSFHLNLGNDRPNVYQEIRTIPNSSDFMTLDFIFEGVEQMERTLVFVNKVVDAQLACKPQRLLPPHLKCYMDFLHSHSFLLFLERVEIQLPEPLTN
jgi:superfamily II DNA helicase RecQ